MSKRSDQEDRLYQELIQETDEIKRETIRAKLYDKLVQHAKAVLWTRFRDNADPHLAYEAAGDVILAIPVFDGRSKFSVYAHSIITNKMCSGMEKHIKYKTDVSLSQEDSPEISNERAEARALAKIQVDEMRNSLESDEQKRTFDSMLVDKPGKEIGEESNISESGARTRTTRVRQELRKKFGSPDGFIGLRKELRKFGNQEVIPVARNVRKRG